MTLKALWNHTYRAQPPAKKVVTIFNANKEELLGIAKEMRMELTALVGTNSPQKLRLAIAEQMSLYLEEVAPQSGVWLTDECVDKDVLARIASLTEFTPPPNQEERGDSLRLMLWRHMVDVLHTISLAERKPVVRV